MTAGRTYRSRAVEDSIDPTTTAGTLPATIEAVTVISTCPKTSAPRPAARVRGTACTRSVPTNCLARSVG